MNSRKGTIFPSAVFFLKVLTVFFHILLIFSYFAPFFHPDTFMFLAFVGLAYPIIIISSLLLLIIWFFIKPRWAFFSLLIIVLGGPLHFRNYSIVIFEDEMKENKLEIMSYNVRLFDIYNPNFNNAKQTRNAIFELLKKENPDVLCLQEYYNEDNSKRFITEDSILSIMKSNYFYKQCSSSQNSSKHFGVATFSKYPIVSSGEVNINPLKEKSFNYCIYTDIIKVKDTIRIYNAHLQSIKLFDKYYEEKYKFLLNKKEVQIGIKKLSDAYSKRAFQADKIMKHIDKSPYPVVVCGDFNDTPFSYTYNIFNRSLVDAFTNTSFGFGSTYLGSLPAGRIDYIFHSNDLTSNSFKIIDKPLSDHCAISCIISK